MATSALSNTRQWHQFQSPSHRGGGAAPLPGVHTSGDGCGFNPLLIGEAAPPGNRRNRHSSNSPCFNPLLIGEAAPPPGQSVEEVVSRCDRFNPLLIGEAAPPLELPALRREAKRSVSIPFSSGRRRRRTGSRRSGEGCTPLVSIPFSSGRRRRRLHIVDQVHVTARLCVFQSPSHRGGGAAVNRRRWPSE